MTTLQAQFLALFFLLAAPFVGSFLALVACRLPAGETIAIGRSHCPTCQTTLAWRDLLPVVSWLVAGRHCRHCRAPVSAFYAGIELAALALALWAWAALPLALLPLACLLGWSLLLLAAIDLRTFTLPDEITLPLLAAGLLATAWVKPDLLLDHLIGALAGGALLWLLAAAYRRLRGRDGLGLGDAKLLAAGGAWLGWQGLGSVILIAAVFGLLAVLVAGLCGRKLTAHGALAFGPCLAMGIWLTWLYGPLGF